MKKNSARTIYYTCMMFAFFVCAVGNATQGYMLTDFINEYSLNAGMQGIVSSSQSLGQILSLLFAFFLAGRMQKTTIVTVAFGVIIFVMLGISFIPAFVLLLALYVLFGLFFGLINTTTSSLVADIYESGKTAMRMNMLHGVYGAGGLAAPLVFLQMTRAGAPWNQIFLWIAIFFAVLFALYFVLIKKSTPMVEMKPSVHVKVSIKDLKTYFKMKANIFLVIATFFYGAHQIVFIVWINRYVSLDLGDEALGALALSLFWVGTTVARLVLPALKLKTTHLLIYGNLVAAILVVVGVLLHSAFAMTLCTLFVGIAGGASVPLLLSTGCDIYPEKTIIATNIVLLSIFVAQMVFPPVIAEINNLISVHAGILTAAILAFATMLFSVLLFREKRKLQPGIS